MDYVDRQSCCRKYFYTRSECLDCPHKLTCKKQHEDTKK